MNYSWEHVLKCIELNNPVEVGFHNITLPLNKDASDTFRLGVADDGLEARFCDKYRVWTAYVIRPFTDSRGRVADRELRLEILKLIPGDDDVGIFEHVETVLGCMPIYTRAMNRMTRQQRKVPPLSSMEF